MKLNKFILPVVIAIGFVVYLSLFIVKEINQAIVLQFGDPKKIISTPGLQVKIPFIQNVVFLDRRILSLDPAPEEVIASDQKRLIVDAFARFKIMDPLKFYISVGNERVARSRLATIINSRLRSVLGTQSLATLLSEDRTKQMAIIQEGVNAEAEKFGIKIIDVRIKRADLPQANSEAIYRRMQTEREREAKEFRARGAEMAVTITSTEDIYHADLFLVIGANPTNAHPVTGAKIKQQVMKGKKLIVLDPITTEVAKLADYHIRLRPGTNVAVLNMMLYFIIKSKLYKEDFILSRTEGFENFLKKIEKLDIDQLAKVAGVDKQQVKEAAIAYATAKNSMEFHGLGVTEQEQGSKTVMLIADLAMITGNIGRKGVGVNPLRGQNNVQGAADMGCQPHQGAGYFPVADKKNQDFYTEKYGVVHPTKAGLKIPQIFDAAINREVKAVWIIGEDVVQTDPNSAHVAKAMNALDLLVVQEIFMSETAKHADVVLPGTTFLEKDGTFTNTERRIQRVNKAAEPLPGTKPDGLIVTEMMQKLGYDQKLYDADEVLNEIADVVPFFKGVSRERLGNLGLQWPVKEDGKDTKILHEKEFKLGKGRIKYFDFKESDEIKTNKKNYPLILTTSRVLQHYNAATMTRRTKNINIVDEDILLIHPKDAKHRELNSGDVARLYSGRGEVSLKVEVTDKVKEGIVFTTFHFPEHMVNMVTGHGKDEETMCAEYKVSSVEVQKISNKFKTEVIAEKDQVEVVPG